MSAKDGEAEPLAPDQPADAAAGQPPAGPPASDTPGVDPSADADPGAVEVADATMAAVEAGAASDEGDAAAGCPADAAVAQDAEPIFVGVRCVALGLL